MSMWIWIALGTFFGLLVAFVAAVFIFGQANSAGITTSRWGRVLGLVTTTMRIVARRMRLRVQKLGRSKGAQEALDKQHEEAAAADVLKTMGNMKGALMKLGQIVSFMDETLPEAYQAELRKLQANAPPMAYDLVAAVIRSELGDDPEALFAEFDKVPMAAASIGQVHRAKLFDGTRVAVKVQYPGVDRAISADLSNYGMLMAMVNVVTPTLDAKPIVEELAARLTEELDYTIEAENTRRFWEIYRDHATIVVPRVFLERSARRVLTTQLIDGIGFYDFAASASVEQKHRAVQAMHTFCFDSLYQHQIFNGDPHPGNYLFLPDGRVGFLDFGCVKHFPPEFLEDFKAMNRLYLLGDRDGYYEQLVKMRFILPNATEKVERDWVWDYIRYYYLPILHDREFTFTKDYCKRAIGTMFGPNMRKLNMPGHFVMLNRITFGLNSIFATLGATENFHRMARRQYFGPGDVERWDGNPPHPEL
jgi:predicted unusual protein kinase regulating ubiquinone biosynthesis (AarF/ABC1/UbiB family)